MSLDLQIIRELAHSGIKTLDAFSGLLELMDMSVDGGLKNPETRAVCRSSLQALSQAISDLRILALCENALPEGRAPLNWNFVIKNGFGRRFLETNSFTAAEADYEGLGYAELIRSAVINISWFSKKFCRGPVAVRLGEEKKNNIWWVRIEWDFGNGLIPPPGFEALDPYTSMVPKESLALDKSTGLCLYTVKKIAELHKGSFTAHIIGNNVKLEFLCPAKPV